MATTSQPPNRKRSLLHALPPPADRHRPRRFALPGLLLGIAGLAFGGLAVLPTAVPATDVLLAQASASSPLQSAAITELLDRPDVKVPALKATPAKKPVAVKKPAAKPSPRATARASRSKRVTVETGGGYVCPVAGRHSFSNDYGDARSGGRRHQGNDILAAYGTPLVAVTSGVVKTAYSSAGGLSLYLRGDDGVEYFYAHNSRNAASSGERVAAGEVIAYVGTSGNARGGPAHVHFERHPGGGGAVNPYTFLVRACR